MLVTMSTISVFGCQMIQVEMLFGCSVFWSFANELRISTVVIHLSGSVQADKRK